MKTIFAVLATAFLCYGCNKRGDRIYYKATIVRATNVTCDLPMLDFSEDSAAITAFTGSSALKYSALQLPQKFHPAGTKVYITLATLNNTDAYPCMMLVATYGLVKVSAAVARN